jgi:hypothetical protein
MKGKEGNKNDCTCKEKEREGKMRHAHGSVPRVPTSVKNKEVWDQVF